MLWGEATSPAHRRTNLLTVSLTQPEGTTPRAVMAVWTRWRSSGFIDGQ